MIIGNPILIGGGSGDNTYDATLSSGSQMLSGITAYASGVKYTGTIPTYSGSVNGGQGSIPDYSYYGGSYVITPSTVSQTFPMAGYIMSHDLTVEAYSGGSAVLSDITISSNGRYSAADSGVDGFANVVVDVPQSPAIFGSKTISSNGVYSASNFGFDGFDEVVVSVASGISPSGSMTLTQNLTTYDVTSLASVYVNVPTSLYSYSYTPSKNWWSRVKYLNPYTFASDANLASASFSACEVVDEHAFEGCVSLSTVSLQNCKSVFYGAFAGCTALTEINLPSCVDLSGTAFSGCTTLSQAILPNVAYISNYVFYHCSALVSISVPIVTTLGGDAIVDCNSLESVYFPAVKIVSNWAIWDCANLETASFPSCERIGFIFASCPNLKSLYLMGSSVVSLLASSVFVSAPEFDIYVPSSLYNQYIVSTHWSYLSSRIISM